MPAIYHEGSWLGNATDPEVLVKDTVGWTGKNLLKNTATTQTINGVIFTVNADGSVTANGTATSNGAELKLHTFGANDTVVGKKLILSGCPTGGGATTYRLMGFRVADASGVSGTIFETGEGETFDYLNNIGTGYISLQIRPNYTANNLTFYPMIRKADITDPTYEPYHESVEVMYEEEIHGVNLLENKATSQTIYGVTFTVNADGSVVANGTCNTGGQSGVHCQLYINIGVNLDTDKRYILSGCPINNIGAQLQHSSWTSGGGYVIDSGNGVEYNGYDAQQYPNNRVMIFIPNGKTANNLVFKPMIRLATIEDSTYRTYNYQAIQNQLNAQGVLGAKNLLPNNASTRTISGITFTPNSDGTITMNGTATADIYWQYLIAFRIKNIGEYILTGCPSGGGLLQTYWFYINKHNVGGSLDNKFDIGEGATYNITDISVTYDAVFGIKSGLTLNNIIFKPMLRLASDPDDTYQPYAMTNRELTEEKINIADLKTVVSASSDFADFKTRIASL